MAKVKYDVSNAEKRSFEVPKPGVYEAVVSDMSHGDSSSGNPMFTIVFEITKGEFKGSRVWYYILTDGSQEWRLREFTDALGLKPKGTLDTDELKGTIVQIKTAVDPARDGFDEKAKIKNVLPTKGSGKGGGADEDEDEAPYEEWELSDLREEAEAREIKISGRVTKKKLVDALEADDEEADGKDEEGEEEDNEGEGDEGTDEDLTRADLAEMSRADLKKLIEEEELEIKVLRKHTDDQLRDKIAEALELEEEEEEGEEEGDEEEDDKDYSEWELSELKAELKERGLKTAGRKSQLVARLEKDDEKDDDEPF